MRIAAPVCELVRNDRGQGTEDGGRAAGVGGPYGGNRRSLVGAAQWAARITHQTRGGLFAPNKTQLPSSIAG